MTPRETTPFEGPIALRPRPVEDWRDMALVTQANLAALRDEQCRRAQAEVWQHDIRTPAPAFVAGGSDPTAGAATHGAGEAGGAGLPRFCECLIDRAGLRALSDGELALRCRQVWGEFSALCWLFRHADPNRPPTFERIQPGLARSPAEVAGKLEHVHRTLWRVRFEQQTRFVEEFALRPDYHELRAAAAQIEVDVYGQSPRAAPAENLVLYACETAGVIGALRWALDDRWEWEQSGISSVGLE